MAWILLVYLVESVVKLARPGTIVGGTLTTCCHGIVFDDVTRWLQQKLTQQLAEGVPTHQGLPSGNPATRWRVAPTAERTRSGSSEGGLRRRVFSPAWWQSASVSFSPDDREGWKWTRTPTQSNGTQDTPVRSGTGSLSYLPAISGL